LAEVELADPAVFVWGLRAPLLNWPLSEGLCRGLQGTNNGLFLNPDSFNMRGRHETL